MINGINTPERGKALCQSLLTSLCLGELIRLGETTSPLYLTHTSRSRCHSGKLGLVYNQTQAGHGALIETFGLVCELVCNMLCFPLRHLLPLV